MPKVKSRGRASSASSSGGAPKCASPRESVRASSSATQGLPAQLSKKRGARSRADQKHVVTSQDPSQRISDSSAVKTGGPAVHPVNRDSGQQSSGWSVTLLSPAENPSSIVPTLPSGFQEVSVTGRGSQPSSPIQVTDLIASSVVQGSWADVSPAALGLVPSTSEGPPPVPEFCRCKKVTLKEIQSLVGLLNFACSVIWPGQALFVSAYWLNCGCGHA